MTQPRALYLADVLDYIPDNLNKAAAAELRRLHEKCEALRNAANRGGHLAVAQRMIDELEAQRDALLGALHSISLASQDSGSTREGMGLYARAAIAKVEEKQ